MSALLALARHPREGAALVVRQGRLGVALLLVAAATVVSALSAARFAGEVSVQEVMFGPQRSPAVEALLGALGKELTAIVLHLVESSWNALIVATAFGPVFVWLLGATAVHAAARLAGHRRPFLPMLVLVGHATGLTRPVGDLAALALGSRGTGASLAQLIGALAFVWLGVLAWRGIQAHYGVPEGKALSILVVAIVFFYLAPLVLVAAAAVAIIVAAIVLEYVPSGGGRGLVPLR